VVTWSEKMKIYLMKKKRNHLGLEPHGFLLNIDYYYGAGVQVCDRQPSVRRVLRPTMKNTLRQD
jgi:hypothetical protein